MTTALVACQEHLDKVQDDVTSMNKMLDKKPQQIQNAIMYATRSNVRMLLYMDCRDNEREKRLHEALENLGNSENLENSDMDDEPIGSGY